MKRIACYIRVSAIAPDLGQQRRETDRWLKSNRINPKSVRWYIDKATADPKRRPRRETLQADIANGKVRAVIVWHLDKLALTTREGLKQLVEVVHQVAARCFGQPKNRGQGFGLLVWSLPSCAAWRKWTSRPDANAPERAWRRH